MFEPAECRKDFTQEPRTILRGLGKDFFAVCGHGAFEGVERTKGDWINKMGPKLISNCFRQRNDNHDAYYRIYYYINKVYYKLSAICYKAYHNQQHGQV